EHVHRVAKRYPIYVALHTDHCLKDKLDKFVLPLVEETERRRAAGHPNLFTGHMFDGSNLSLQENLDISAKLLPLRRRDESIHPGPSIACGPKDDEADGDRKKESRAINDVRGACLVLAAAGMCNGGRILHHLRANLWKPSTHVLIVGYQGHGSLGRQLV